MSDREAALIGMRTARGGGMADDARLTALTGGGLVLAAATTAMPSPLAATAAIASYGAATALILPAAARAGALRRFGWANRITWIRVVLAALLTGFLVAAAAETVAESPATEQWPPVHLPPVHWPGAHWLGAHWPIVALAAAAWLLDGLDGLVARRLDQARDFGARFDREVDAALILILSLLVFATGKTGAWIVAAGAMRYAFLAAGRLWPVLARPLPDSRARSIVCGALVGSLLVCLSPLAEGMAAAIGGAALGALTLSFGRDVVWLLTRADDKV